MGNNTMVELKESNLYCFQNMTTDNCGGNQIRKTFDYFPADHKITERLAKNACKSPLN
jgi:hypothetical protein